MGKFPPNEGEISIFSLFGLYFLKSLSDFDETWYVRFLGNLALYFGDLNPVGKFPRHGGKGQIFKILDFDEIWYARPLGTLPVLFLG